MASKKIAVFGDLWKIAGAFLRESIAGLRGETSCPDFSAQGIEEKWCGRWELNPHGPFKPCGFSCRLRLSPPGRAAWRPHARFAVWTIPSPSPGRSGA